MRSSSSDDGEVSLLRMRWGLSSTPGLAGRLYYTWPYPTLTVDVAYYVIRWRSGLLSWPSSCGIRARGWLKGRIPFHCRHAPHKCHHNPTMP